MLSMNVCTTRYWQTSCQLVQGLNVCTVYTGSIKIYSFACFFQPFMNCRIGSPGVKITSSDQSQQLFQQLTESKMKFPSMNLKLPFQGQNKAQTDITVNSIAMGTQDETWGSPVSLQGHLGYVCIFHEAIQLGQVQSLHNLGTFTFSFLQVQIARPF